MSDPAIFNNVLSCLNRKDPQVAVQVLIDTYGSDWVKKASLFICNMVVYFVRLAERNMSKFLPTT